MTSPTNEKRRRFLATQSSWLLALWASPVVSLATSRLVAQTTPPPAAKVPQDPTLELLWARANLLLAQLAQGLSYNGRSRDSVSRRNPATLRPILTDLTNYSAIITNRVATLASIIAVEDSRYSELNDSANMAQQQRQSLDNETSTLSAQYNDLNSKMADLDRLVREAADALHTASVAFQTAVRTAAKAPCGFIDVIKAAGAIVAIAQGAMNALPALATAFEQLEAGGTGLENLKLISKTLEPVGGDFTRINEGYAKIMSYLDSNSKGAMLVVSPDDLAARVQDVMSEIDKTNVSFADRESFKDAIRHYMNTVQMRNLAILELDADALKIVANETESRNLLMREKQLRDAANNAVQADLKQLAIALGDLNRNFLRQVRDFLWTADRAVDYYALRHYVPDSNLRTDDVAQIANAVGNVLLSVEGALNELPGTPELFPTSPQIPFVIEIRPNPSQRRSMSRGSLLIALDPFVHRPQGYPRAVAVFANAIQVVIDGLPRYSGYLTHLGPSRFASASGAKISFRTSPETRKISEHQLSLGNGLATLSTAGLVGDSTDEYLGLSPFSDWLLEIDASSNWHRFSRARSIGFTFFGTMRTA